jgi:hypothetical protein
MTRRWRALLGVAAVALLALGAWGARDRVVSEWRTWARKGQLQWEAPDGWRVVAWEDERRRSWSGHQGFLHGLPYAELEPGLELAELRIRRTPNPQVVPHWVLRVDPELWRFRVLAQEDFALLPVDAHAGTLPVAFNASFYSETGPLGLVVQDGRERGRQNSVWAAHFLVDPAAPPRIVNQKNAGTSGVLQGVQGFPAVMQDGRTYAYMRNGDRGFPVHEVARRTGICLDDAGRVVVLVTASRTNGLTLDELATMQGGLGCRDAMGLDGGSSTALWIQVPGQSISVKSRDGVPVAIGLESR